MELDIFHPLKHIFGYESFRPGQERVIRSVVGGKDTIAMLPTGMGKSLCYQLPGYLYDKPVLIISPLLSLMQDQVDQLKLLGEKRVVAFNSFLSFAEKQYALNYLEQYRFIFVSPEMLAQQNLQERFQQIQFSLIVVDEAHCISQWGFDFRPDYLRIKSFVATIPHTPKLALTATATAQVLNDIEEYLLMEQPQKFIESIDRPNIKIAVEKIAHKSEKKQWLIDHIEHTQGPGVVYMQSRSRANELSALLLQKNIKVAAYHGGLENIDRQFIQQQFINGSLEWIIATNAFGMGVHKHNIRQVIHETMPGTLANYMQEIGRAGRDGEESIAITLYSPNDEELAYFLAQEDLPSDQQVDAFLQVRHLNYTLAQYMEQFRITETMLRVLDYWSHIKNDQQLKLQLEEMRLIKKQQVFQVQQVITGNTCIREQLVTYFGQTIVEKVENCCSNCDLNYKERLKPIIKSPETIIEVDWEQRLRSLLI